MSEPKIVRLSVNLSPTVAAVLKGYARRHGVTATEAIRRAIAFLYLVESNQQAGGTVLIRHEGQPDREVVIL